MKRERPGAALFLFEKAEEDCKKGEKGIYWTIGEKYYIIRDGKIDLAYPSEGNKKREVSDSQKELEIDWNRYGPWGVSWC